jgi:hypothetical protein
VQQEVDANVIEETTDNIGVVGGSRRQGPCVGCSKGPIEI